MSTYAEEKRIRPDILTASVYLSVAAMMAFIIVCQRIYGDKGAFFSAGPLTVYLFCYCSLVISVQKAVYIMVRLRARRSQYLNAEANMHRSMRVFGVAGLLLGTVCIVLCFTISKRLFGADRDFIQMIIIGVSILFLGVQGVLRGYLQGIGYTRPIVIADLLIAVVSFVSGTIAVGILYNYGLKVNDLFHSDEFSAVYGSTGMMIGILIGSMAGFIQIVVSYNLRKNEIANFVKSGAPRYLDNKNDVIAGIRPILLLYSTPVLVVLIDQCVYTIFTGKMHADVDMMNNYGIYSGRILSTVILISIICCLPFVKNWNRVMARIERDELEGARERFRRLVRYSNMLFIPVSVFIFALSDTLQVSFFGKSSDLAGVLMMYGGISVFLCCFAIMIAWLLSHMGKSLVVILNTALCLGIHVAALIVFMMILDRGLYGVFFSLNLAILAFDAMGFFMISKMLKYSQNHLRIVLFPFAAAAGSGLVVFFINKLLVNLIGDILTLIVCIFVFYVIYMLILVFSGCLRGHELRRIPFGTLFAGFSRDSGDE